MANQMSMFYDALYRAMGERAPERSLSPPERRRGALDDRFDELYAESMLGAGEFWNGFDNDQHIRIMESVRRMLSGIGLTDAERIAIVTAAVSGECEKYAHWKAQR
jgi:hypothetical protein